MLASRYLTVLCFVATTAAFATGENIEQLPNQAINRAAEAVVERVKDAAGEYGDYCEATIDKITHAAGTCQRQAKKTLETAGERILNDNTGGDEKRSHHYAGETQDSAQATSESSTLNMVKETAEWLAANAKVGIERVPDVAKQTVDMVKNAAEDVAHISADIIHSEAVGKLAENLKEAALLAQTATVNAAQTIGKATVDAYNSDTTKKTVEYLKETGEKILEVNAAAAKNAYEFAKETAEGLLDDAHEYESETAEKTVKLMKETAETLVTRGAETAESIKQASIDAYNSETAAKVFAFVQEKAEQLKSASIDVYSKKTPHNMVESLTNAAENAVQLGILSAQMAVQSVRDAYNGEAATNAFQYVRDAADNLKQATVEVYERKTLKDGVDQLISAAQRAVQVGITSASMALNASKDAYNSAAAQQAIDYLTITADLLKNVSLVSADALMTAGVQAYNSETTDKALNVVKQAAMKVKDSELVTEAVDYVKERLYSEETDDGSDVCLYRKTGGQRQLGGVCGNATTATAFDLESILLAAEGAVNFVGDRLSLAYDSIRSFERDMQRQRNDAAHVGM